jgi:uncharacterized membrane protein
MNWVYFHLIINHFPIIGLIIGTLILIAGLIFNNQGIKISGLGTTVFASLMAIVAYMSGDPAGEVMKALPDVTKSLISRHENIATISVYLLLPTGLMAATTMYSILRKEKSVRFLLIITLVLSLISCAVIGYVGRTGGQIRHTEFRNDATKQYIIEHQNDTDEGD